MNTTHVLECSEYAQAYAIVFLFMSFFLYLPPRLVRLNSNEKYITVVLLGVVFGKVSKRRGGSERQEEPRCTQSKGVSGSAGSCIPQLPRYG